MNALRLAEALIARASVTPADGGCQALLAQRLARIGFECETLVCGPQDFRVTNLFALRRGSRPGPTLAFAGHTDVVPTGPLERWQSDPFVPTHRDGHLFGRGAADMKTSIAAMVVAAEEFVAAQPEHAGAIALLLTSDEEGPSVDGTVRLVEALQQRGMTLDACIVGEPTSVERLGDMVKNGRRGTLSGRLVVKGVQGHIAYPQLARNPIHELAPALAELVATRWDEGNEFFPPTSWQVSNIHAGTGAGNVIPGDLELQFNFRFSNESTPESLQARVQALLDRHGIDYQLTWTLGGETFLTPPGSLSRALGQAIHDEVGLRPALSTTGGTSDGRFIARICPQVVEFGPVNASIHKIDENVRVDDIERLKDIYRRTLDNFLAAAAAAALPPPPRASAARPAATRPLHET
jgi:succinyl-diaminopimelate desuccinylase